MKSETRNIRACGDINKTFREYFLNKTNDFNNTA